MAILAQGSSAKNRGSNTSLGHYRAAAALAGLSRDRYDAELILFEKY